MNIKKTLKTWYRKYIRCQSDKYVKYPDGSYMKDGIVYERYDHITDQSLTEKYSCDQRDKIHQERLRYFNDMSDSEYVRFKEFQRDHRHDEVHYDGPKFWIGFSSGGGIGTCVHVKCAICGEEHDITDVTCW